MIPIIPDKKKNRLIKYITKLEAEFENYEVSWGGRGIGYAVWLRTYSKWIKEGLKEELNNLVARGLRQAIKNNVPYTKYDLRKIFKYSMDLKMSFSGRYQWSAESKLALSGINNSFINCYYRNLDKLEDFCKIFDNLMLGSGEGFSVRKRHSEKLPEVIGANIVFDNKYSFNNLNDEFKEFGGFVDCYKESQVDEDGFEGTYYCVGDSREGWVDGLNKIIESLFITGNELIINTTLIREKNLPIKGFGGTSSGDEDLIKYFKQIIELINNAKGRKLTSVEILDIVCLIGSIVVSGNVRRTALICIGDIDDINFITCKRHDLKEVPHYRGNVNISVECNNSDFNKLPQEFWDSYEKLGECIGLCNIENAQKYGRMGKNAEKDLKKYYSKIIPLKYPNKHFKNVSDPMVEGTNACSETSLPSGSHCDLAMIFSNNCKSYKEKEECIKYVYMNNKVIASGRFFHDTEQLNNESRLGLDLVGSPLNFEQSKKDGERLYRFIRKFDFKFSDRYGLPYSIKITTSKPNGTQALIAWELSGIHWDEFLFFYRTVRFASNDPMLPAIAKLGYRIEDLYTKVARDIKGEPILNDDGEFIPFEVNPETKVVYFACKSLCEKTNDNSTALEQLKLNEEWQEAYIDQSISQTVKFQEGELPIIREYMSNNWHKYKNISFLKNSKYNFPQMPLIKISKEEYENYINKTIPISKQSLGKYSEFAEIELKSSVECQNGVCPIK